jgi:hypothetical protein
MTTTSQTCCRRTPADALRTAHAMRALGARGLPREIAVGGRSYRLIRDVKHDFFAATGFYEADNGDRVVLKASRNTDFLGIPLAWLGRWLRNREMRFYARLRDLPNIPNVLAAADDTSFVLEFVAGQPLKTGLPVPDGFFDRLRELLDEIHRRGIAYVDMNKKANIIIGPNGAPHLVDFQISWDLCELGDNALNRRILKRLQQEDIYHINKHQSRLRPDEMTPQQMAASQRQSVLIRLHRTAMKPWFGLRRRTWQRLRQTGRLLPEGSE